MRTPMIRVLLLAALLTGARATAAATMVAPVAPRSTVSAGDEIITVIPALPPRAREFELMLEPEVGPAIQVSPELEAGVREVRWRVPRIVARRARLVLRAGGERFETESPASAWFGIAPPRAGVTERPSMLRTLDALAFDGSHRSLPGLSSSPPPAELSAGSPACAALPAPPAPALCPPDSAPAEPVGVFPSRAPNPAPAARSRAPAVRPRRN